MPVRAIITDGTRADCQQAKYLIDGIWAENLLADRADDTNELLSYLEEQSINPVIPPKKNRCEQRVYDIVIPINIRTVGKNHNMANIFHCRGERPFTPTIILFSF